MDSITDIRKIIVFLNFRLSAQVRDSDKKEMSGLFFGRGHLLDAAWADLDFLNSCKFGHFWQLLPLQSQLTTYPRGYHANYAFTAYLSYYSVTSVIRHLYNPTQNFGLNGGLH